VTRDDEDALTAAVIRLAGQSAVTVTVGLRRCCTRKAGT